jgi:ribosomal protein S14
MLKINLRNEKLNRRMVKKELTYLLQHLFFSFYQNALKQNFVQKYFLNYHLKWLTGSPFTKVRTLCFLTGRSRSVYRSFHLSRLKIREYAGFGYFPGLSKASW